MARYVCPVCGTLLSKDRYEKALGIWEERRKQLDELERELSERRRSFVEEQKAWRSEQRRKIQEAIQQGKQKEKRRADRLAKQLDGALRAIREKEEQISDLKEQLKRGTTPQIEGLLDEAKFASLLKEAFPEDRIEHTGKGGDVLQHVRLNGRPVGTIVYECKRVPKVLSAHITQTKRAITQRNASYGVLVTVGTKRGRFGFWSERGIFVVHPLGATSFAGVLRDSMIEVARMQLTRKEREAAARRIFEFLSGPEFKNNMQDVLQRAVELREMLHKEARTHLNIWRKRYEYYKSIYESTSTVRSRFHRILETSKQLPAAFKALSPIEKWAQFSLPF